jgi:hypothetical protein
MYWYNTFRYKEHTSIYMNIVEFLNTYDSESHTFKNEIKNYEDPMNLSPRSRAKQESLIKKLLSLFIKV